MHLFRPRGRTAQCKPDETIFFFLKGSKGATRERRPGLTGESHLRWLPNVSASQVKNAPLEQLGDLMGLKAQGAINKHPSSQ